MVATDIDDRSILFASENVKRNRLQDRITVFKNTGSLIFAEDLFTGKEQRYDFCMCNPPFYEDEQDIRDSLEGKTNGPNAACQGTVNEMMTVGGEVLFVQKMVDESTRWQTRIRWYTSMLGKRSSVDKITAYLKDRKASTKQISNKMVKLAPPKTVLSFEEMNITPEAAEERSKNILARLKIDHNLQEAVSPAEGDLASVLHARAGRNTWSRAARRALARDANNKEGSGCTQTEPLSGPAVAPILEFDIRISAHCTRKKPSTAKEATLATAESTPGVSVALAWTMGQDRALFESFFLHFRDSFSRRQ
ncbi:hypothetical protein BGZ75_008893 [Mortierella antarctica]|nr:hypothetical protein BGZ75_008893 [Mortierella antarctica]